MSGRLHGFLGACRLLLRMQRELLEQEALAESELEEPAGYVTEEPPGSSLPVARLPKGPSQG